MSEKYRFEYEDGQIRHSNLSIFAEFGIEDEECTVYNTETGEPLTGESFQPSYETA